MKYLSIGLGIFAGLLSFAWATSSMVFSESVGLGFIVGTATEWLIAFFTKKDLAITTEDLKQQALQISKTLRELQGDKN